MLSTAQINDQDQYLILSGEGVTLRNDHSEASDVADSLSGNGLFHHVSTFYYNDRVRLAFLVADRFKADFAFIRGLIEFHRPRNLVFNFDRKSSSVGIDIDPGQLNNLQAFFTGVLDWFVKEKQFRHALRIAIEFENRYRLERDSVYTILKNTTAAMCAV